MTWEEYLSHLLSKEKSFDDISVSLDSGVTYSEIPPIIKSSVLMLDEMIEKQGPRNIIIFPEKKQSIVLFSLMKLFHNISLGKIKSNYDPTGFVAGEKLKVGKAIVEYLGPDEYNGEPGLAIRLADCDRLVAPLRHFPIFQQVDTKKKISKIGVFSKARKEALAAMKSGAIGNEELTYAASMKTHMDSTIFVMTSILGAKKQLSECRIGNKKVTEIFYFGQTNYEGNISNISPGQMKGVPAIVLASDLYSIQAAIDNNQPIQSIIIDASNMKQLLDQLDVLDELLKMHVPIVCLTDTVNSFDLSSLITRNFNIWRWDKESLTSQLYDAVPLMSDKRIKNCAGHNVIYLQTDGGKISDAMRRLALHRRETENQSGEMMKIFEKLNRFTFLAMRAVIPFSDIEIKLACDCLEDCRTILAKEAVFISDASFSDYSIVINNLLEIYSHHYALNKFEMLKNFLNEHTGSFLYLIISESVSKTDIQKFWDDYIVKNRLYIRIRVVYPSEYYSFQGSTDGNAITIISGWLKRVIMRRVIYSFITNQYCVLLYDYERKWQRQDSTRWKNALRASSNKVLVEKVFSTDDVSISTERFVADSSKASDPNPEDELGEIELILHDNKIRRYAGRMHGGDIVSAVPVNFVGGFIAFFRPGHKVISATKIILDNSNNIEMKIPEELTTGDFIVIREADRDIIRDLADDILINSGKKDAREKSSIWRDALQIELLFSTTDELYEKIKTAGCDKEYATVRHWIEDASVIAPQSKDDIAAIAKATENEVLLETLDSVFEAAAVVRRAHKLAGKKLSDQLKKTIAEELKDYGEIDPYNIWEPLEIEVDGIGTVKVLKVIDIGAEIKVDSTDTNRLIEE